ncbi:MAG: hypothetical protein R6X08_12380 [Desulfosalsimonadaceae bacterium]
MEAVECIGGLIDFHVMGRGFTWKSDNLEKGRPAGNSGQADEI